MANARSVVDRLFKVSVVALLMTSSAMAAASQRDIDAAIRQLGDGGYAIREKASTLLWSCGTDALPALEAAAKTDDPEVSFRAREIAKKIRSGVVPGMSPETAQLIRQYRGGSLDAKRAVIHDLLGDEGEGFDVVLNLVRGEKDPQERQRVVAGLSAELDRLVKVQVANGELDKAQELLGLSSECGDKRMMRALALMATVRGNSDHEIKARAGRAKVDPWQALTLAYLYRAAGDFEKAVAAAELGKAEREAGYLRREAGDWDALVTAIEKNPAPNNIEWLGLRLAYCRLAGNRNQQAKAVGDVEAYVKTRPEASWYAAEALLINDEPARAIEVLRTGKKYKAAAKLLYAQMRFDEVATLVREAEAQGVPEKEVTELKQMLKSVGITDAEPPVPPKAATGEKAKTTPEQWRALAREQAALSRALPDAPFPMFLHGFALRQAGDTDKGELIMKQATLLPLADESKRYELIKELAKRGLHSEASAQRDLVLRTAPFESWHLGEALRSYAVGQALREKNYERAAFYQEQSRLLLLRQNTAIVEISGYMLFGWRIAWWHAQDRLAKGEVDEAVAQIRKCMAIFPGEITAPIWLCGKLDQRKQKTVSDEMFTECLAILEAVCKRYPDSGRFRNQVAWLTARCRRGLEKGLVHANKAVESSPDNAAYLDTLAEVHFQMGHQAKAIELMKRCIELEPRTPYFQRQLKRFEAGDPTTDPEE